MRQFTLLLLELKELISVNEEQRSFLQVKIICKEYFFYL